jgi:3-hydroxyacyl-CoA dehydrogenase
VIDRVAITNAGMTGAGIVQAVAVAGTTVRLTNVDADAVSRALMRIARRWPMASPVTRSIDAAVKDADLLIEAVAQDLDVKGNVFARADELGAPHVDPPDILRQRSAAAISARRLAEVSMIGRNHESR